MSLSGGKTILQNPAGDPAAISYGDHSPTNDASPLSWRKGDVRYYQEVGASENSKTSIKWVCIAAGTPGVWQLVRLPYMLPVLSTTNVFSGVFGYGGETFMAPATADWVQATPPVNTVPIPLSFDLEANSPGPGPTMVNLAVFWTQNSWTVEQGDGLLFRIRYITAPFSDGVVVGSGPAPQGGLGWYDPIATLLPAGVISGGGALVASLEHTGGGVNTYMAMVAVMTLYRDFTADFAS